MQVEEVPLRSMEIPRETHNSLDYYQRKSGPLAGLPSPSKLNCQTIFRGHFLHQLESPPKSPCTWVNSAQIYFWFSVVGVVKVDYFDFSRKKFEKLVWFFFDSLLNFLKMNFGTLCHIVKVWRYGPFNEEECRGAFFAACCQSPFFVENLWTLGMLVRHKKTSLCLLGGPLI